MLILPAIDDTDPIRCPCPSHWRNLFSNIPGEAMRPLERRVGAVVLAPSELVRVAETARARIVGFIREMIRQIDPKHETERLEAVAFALAEVSDAMNNLIGGHGERRH